MGKEKKELFLFKQKSYDFIVEERLPFELDGKGDAFFVYFEKQNITTMWVIQYLCKELKISRLTLGIAGLKDKDAITRQRISIYQSALKRIGGERVFLNKLSNVAKIIKTDYHHRPLQMTDEIENHFYIRLRAKQKIGQEDKLKAKWNIEKLFEKWFPNFFGSQRFWINGRNWKIWKDIVEKKTKVKDNFEAKFKLQSYSSRLFNQYAKERLVLSKEKMDGEVLKNWEITGPVWGYDTKLAKINTEIWNFQTSFMQKYNINSEFFDCYKKYKIYGIARNIRVNPKRTNVRYQWDDLLIEFSLPSGSYASVLIYQMLEKLQ